MMNEMRPFFIFILDFPRALRGDFLLSTPAKTAQTFQSFGSKEAKYTFKGSLVKVEVALCKGKHAYEKKRTISERDEKRAMDRAAKEAFMH